MPSTTLFDTEILNPALNLSELIFFQKPRGCDFTDRLSGIKGPGETNLLQSAMLDYPRSHQVTGFGCYLEIGIDIDDWNEIGKAAFEFRRGGSTIFSQSLMMFPNFNTSLIPSQPDLEDESQKARSIFSYKYADGRPAYSLYPGEAFNVILLWTKPPKVSKPIRITVVIDGIAGTAGMERGSGIPDAYPIAYSFPLDKPREDIDDFKPQTEWPRRQEQPVKKKDLPWVPKRDNTIPEVD